MNFKLTLSMIFTIIKQSVTGKCESNVSKTRNLSSKGQATQKRNITPGTHKESSLLTTRRTMNGSRGASHVGIPEHKKVRHRVEYWMTHRRPVMCQSDLYKIFYTKLRYFPSRRQTMNDGKWTTVKGRLATLMVVCHVSDTYFAKYMLTIF